MKLKRVYSNNILWEFKHFYRMLNRESKEKSLSGFDYFLYQVSNFFEALRLITIDRKLKRELKEKFYHNTNEKVYQKHQLNIAKYLLSEEWKSLSDVEFDKKIEELYNECLEKETLSTRVQNSLSSEELKNFINSNQQDIIKIPIRRERCKH